MTIKKLKARLDLLDVSYEEDKPYSSKWTGEFNPASVDLYAPDGFHFLSSMCHADCGNTGRTLREAWNCIEQLLDDDGLLERCTVLTPCDDWPCL